MGDKYEREQALARVACREGDRSAQVGNLKKRLARIGYLHPEVCDCEADLYCAHTRRAVRLYQTYFRLPETGHIDVRTLKHISRKRCGCPDVPPDVAQAANLSDEGISAGDPFVFNFNTQPWASHNLTYHVYNRCGDLSGEVGLIDQAFRVWAEHSPLRFTRTSDRASADIELGWETGSHGDGSDFDGFGDILAHGFYPTTGVVHFDDAEYWIDWDDSNWFLRLIGADLLHVAIHEIGHALGLDHSREEGAIMYPYANYGRHSLAEEDIRGIQSIYPFPVGAGDPATVVHLWAFSGGTHSAVVDLGRERRFVAWGQTTFVDSLIDYDRDNGVALDIFTIDGNHPARVGYGGDHLGSDGAPSNLFAGAVVGRGRRVQFRLSTFHSSDLEAYGVGCVLALD